MVTSLRRKVKFQIQSYLFLFIRRNSKHWSELHICYAMGKVKNLNNKSTA